MKTAKTVSNLVQKDSVTGKTFENKNIHTASKKEHTKGYTNGIVPHANSSDKNK